ncbi:dTDP-4-dehydrorhamnose reductase [Tropicimonas aquimaris]|uniref:dTDP-4-dehydrorhamnose reductase n=1 Tax=Tropicimonas aquimaris TaxID=914152 RepID=A0ABW3IVC0_9RHOB
MKLLVFGRSGQVGLALRRAAASAGVEMVALGRAEADLAEPGACARAIKRSDADVVINAAAYTAVDRAEDEPELAGRVNAQAAGEIAHAAAERGLPLLHLSTDYVFDGNGAQPWRPVDTPSPVNAYGRSKLDGEAAIADVGGTHVILRTSWVFSAHGTNFVRTMLRLAESRAEIAVVSDQIGGPTSAAALAEALLTLARASTGSDFRSGVHHLSGAPDTSWAGFAREIFRLSGRDVRVREIPSAEFPMRARRPLNSRLDCTSLTESFGIARPDWRDGLREVLAEIAMG